MIKIDEAKTLQILQNEAIWDSDSYWTYPIGQQLYAQMMGWA